MTNNHPDLQLARSRLATVQGLLGGESERTEARLRAALDGLQMAVGNDDASTANAMTNLALFLKGDGQLAEATELYTTALETRCAARNFVVVACRHVCATVAARVSQLAQMPLVLICLQPSCV